MNFNGLTTINIELTSRCNKSCWMCGRRKMEKEYPKIAENWGDMDFDLVKKISYQLPKGIVIQFHNNGESLLYPKFGEAVSLFKNQIKCLDTNGKLIVEKSDEIINNLDTLTISVIEDDLEGKEQYELVKQFIDLKKKNKPNLIYRCLGKVDIDKWKKLQGLITTRTLHSPYGSFKYKNTPTIPEIGICLDALNHLCIDRYGKVSMCVRFDPNRIGIIGDVNIDPLSNIWNGSKRLEWIRYHIDGQRYKIPLCSKCEYWGVPTRV
jgi:radical SAM protein with 4Fe4S-binding SPASM domain